MKTTVAKVTIDKKASMIPTVFSGNYEHHCEACQLKVVQAFEKALSLSFEASMHPSFNKNRKPLGISYEVTIFNENQENTLDLEPIQHVKLGKRRN